MASTPLWLSHHEPAHYSRCVRVAGRNVCARCLGVYPVLAAALGAQIIARVGMASRFDLWMALALPLPALIDWGRGRFWPASGSNGMRLFTGALLGLALGRTLYLHARRPGHPLAMAQLLGLLMAAGTVEAARFWWRRTDPSRVSPVQGSDRSDRER